MKNTRCKTPAGIKALVVVGCAALLAACGSDRSESAERQLKIRYPGCEIYRDYKVQEINGDTYWMIRKADGSVIRVKTDGLQFVSEEIFFPANTAITP